MNIKIKEERDYNQIKIVCNFVSRKIKKQRLSWSYKMNVILKTHPEFKEFDDTIIANTQNSELFNIIFDKFNVKAEDYEIAKDYITYKARHYDHKKFLTSFRKDMMSKVSNIIRDIKRKKASDDERKSAVQKLKDLFELASKHIGYKLMIAPSFAAILEKIKDSTHRFLNLPKPTKEVFERRRKWCLENMGSLMRSEFGKANKEDLPELE